MAQAGDVLFAATSDGLLTSGTAGNDWNWVPGLERRELLYVSASRGAVVAASLRNMMASLDGGKHWKEVKLPETLSQVSAVAVDGDGALWVGGREGIFSSPNDGATWETLKNVYIRDVNSIFYDAATERVLITAGGASTMAFAVHIPDRAVRFWDSGWNLRFVRAVGDHLVAATLFDGIVVQPQMVDSADLPKR